MTTDTATLRTISSARASALAKQFRASLVEAIVDDLYRSRRRTYDADEAYFDLGETSFLVRMGPDGRLVLDMQTSPDWETWEVLGPARGGGITARVRSLVEMAAEAAGDPDLTRTATMLAEVEA